MNILFAAVALAAAQAAPAGPVDHSQHTATQHANHKQGQHQAEQKCCKEVNGRKECQMMEGHGDQHQGQTGEQSHEGHGSSH